MDNNGVMSEIEKDVVAVVSAGVDAVGSGLHAITSMFSHLKHTHKKKPPYLIRCEESKRFREMDSYGRDMILVCIF